MMSEFEKIYRNIICEENDENITQQEMFRRLKIFLGQYWDCNDQTVSNIISQLRGDFSNEKFSACEYIKIVCNKEFLQTLAQECPEQIVNFANYIKNPTLELPLGRYVSVEDMRNKGRINLTDKVFDVLCNRVEASDKNINEGKGQKLLITLFKNVRAPINKESSDVFVDGIKGEVKAKEARVMGQKGYGEFKTTIETFKRRMKSINYFSNKQIEQMVLDSLNGDFYITQIDANNSIYQKVYALCDEFQKIELKKIIFDTYKQLFLLIQNSAAAKKYLERFVEDIFNNIKECRSDFIKLSLLYYSFIDGWKYLILVDNRGEHFRGFYANVVEDNDEILNNIINNITIKSWPQASPASSKRNSVIQIIIKNNK